MTNTDTPKLIRGGLAADDRGYLKFINDFQTSGFKRFYVVENHISNFVRAWHGHKQEAKAVVCLQGSAIVAVVEPDNWIEPSRDLEVSRYVLSGSSPSALFIPAGYANGFKTLTPDAMLLFFSTSTLEESMVDDFRFPARLWNPWDVEER